MKMLELNKISADIQNSEGLHSDLMTCGICPKRFPDVLTFLLHKAQHVSTFGTYQCELCGKPYMSHTVLLYHYRATHKLQLLLPSDTANADKKMAAQQVVQTTAHTNNTVHQGGMQASKNFDFHFILATETVKGNLFDYGRTIFKCIYCTQKCFSKDGLISHMWSKHAVVDFLQNVDVALCGGERLLSISEFESCTKLETVLAESRSRKRKALLRSARGKKFFCLACGKVFSNRQALQLHMDTHELERTFLCDTCSTAFKSPTHLLTHRRMHHTKGYKCHQCGFQSDINAVVHLHRQQHKDGSVLCAVCGTAYSDRSTVNKHMRVHAVERPYGCSYEGCSWRFKTEMMLKAHIRAHATRGRFECSTCGYLFRHKHHLQRHEARMHKDLSLGSTQCIHLQESQEQSQPPSVCNSRGKSTDLEMEK
ncbi:zinc finger protein 585A-like isoform X2 [Protopterus annectens]|uniref:zinc finger protein 585A-like isoform X2 n=1 Tax=Protopterus annectens TaxID=7888 RepID=UPI001CFBA7A9|nr:zinc finger protein 585A-like isoform X2 [Protopterus annectens]